MRRGHIIRGITVLVSAVTVGCGIAAGSAAAASPGEICAAIAAGTFNAADYNAADLAAYQQALQTDTTIQGYCSPLVFVPVTTRTVTTTVPQTTTTTTTTTTTAAATPAAPTAGVAGASAEKSTPAAQTAAPTTGVAGAQKVKTAAPATAAPLASTRRQGSLPFTGVELAVFAVVGAVLLAGGLLLRLTARQKDVSA